MSTKASKTGAKAKAAKLNAIIGFHYGGFYKSGYVKFFKHAGKIEDIIDGLRSDYGEDVKGRYVLTDELDVHFDALCKKCEDSKVGNDVYKMMISPIVELVKEVSGSTTARRFGVAKKKEDESDEDSDAEKKPVEKKKSAPKKEVKKEDSDDESEEEKKPVEKKKSAPKKEVKKEEKKEDSDDESEEEKKPVEKKKSAPKKEVKKEDSEDSDDESEEKKPVEKKKSAPKKGKKKDSDEEDSDDESD